MSYYRNNKFNSKWSVYLHDKYDKNWCLESYKKLWVIEDELTFWQFFNSFSDLTTNNYYFMRDDIEPTHEYVKNKNGIDLCYNIRKNLDYFNADSCHSKNMKFHIVEIIAKLVCNNLTDNRRDSNKVNGIELIAKETKTIIKIWLDDKDNIPLINHRINNYNPIRKYRRNETKDGSRQVLQLKNNRVKKTCVNILKLGFIDSKK